MYSNIGEKIKVFAAMFCGIGMLISFFSALCIWSKASQYHDDASAVVGLAVLVIGCLASWIGSFFTYGFGQLIEHAKNIDEKLNGTGTPSKAETRPSPTKQWLDEDLISEEEYNKIIGRKDE
ncbi:hypothetical protein J6T93_01275 [bacterium]|nr:hypothetical protein [bacterium]